MRHAFLILAHTQSRQLVALINKLGADCYVNWDSDEKHPDCSSKFIERHRAIWGKPEMVKAELALLEAAISGGYDYFHLLSGLDFPVKTIEELDAFCEKNKEKEFVGFRPQICKDKFFGSQWWSITREFADWCLEHQQDPAINGSTYPRCVPDEMFFQTLLMRSPFAGNVYKWPERQYDHLNLGNLRYIRMSGCHAAYLNEMDMRNIAADQFFARKVAEGGIVYKRLIANE